MGNSTYFWFDIDTPELVNMTTSGATNNANFIKMTVFLIQRQDYFPQTVI